MDRMSSCIFLREEHRAKGLAGGDSRPSVRSDIRLRVV